MTTPAESTFAYGVRPAVCDACTRRLGCQRGYDSIALLVIHFIVTAYMSVCLLLWVHQVPLFDRAMLMVIGKGGGVPGRRLS